MSVDLSKPLAAGIQPPCFVELKTLSVKKIWRSIWWYIKDTIDLLT